MTTLDINVGGTNGYVCLSHESHAVLVMHVTFHLLLCNMCNCMGM